MFQLRQRPMWIRYLVAFGVAAAVIAAVVVYVDDHQTPLAQPPAGPNRQQLAREQRQDYKLVQQQQAPRAVRLAAGADPLAAVTAAVRAYMRHQVSQTWIAGPDQGGSCRAAGGSGARQLFRCTMRAGGLNYPFSAVAQPGAGRLTYCQVVTPPIPSLRVPLSAACR